jgi:hypothetical protein
LNARFRIVKSFRALSREGVVEERLEDQWIVEEVLDAVIRDERDVLRDAAGEVAHGVR